MFHPRFNPRPRAGGDPDNKAPTISLPCFNPRPRAGGDQRTAPSSRCRSGVSIHAPAQGATYRGLCPNTDCWFQSTPPRRGRLGVGMPLHLATSSFNPRPRAGGDLPILPATSGSTVFQSTPPRRGRRRQRKHGWGLPCFNPRPRAGGDRSP